MTKVPVAEELAAKIRASDGPIELVDAIGRTIGLVRRPPTEADITKARSTSTPCKRIGTYAAG
jgi:hypothetical protein